MQRSVNGFEDVLSQLREEFVQRLRSDAAAISNAWDCVRAGADRDEGLARLIQLTHRLAGLGKTMGFADVSTASFAVEQTAERVAQEPSADLSVLSFEVDRLEDVLKNCQ